MTKQDLINLHEKNKIDYLSLSKELYFKNRITEKQDISVIIPVRGRTEFLKPVSYHLNQAIKKSGLKISLTYIEHSVLSEYLHPVQDSFIWVPCNKDSKFNKCLCFNMGFMYGPPADYYLFYDSDLICREDFFEQVVLNISDVVQTFKGKRVLYANEALTNKLVKHDVYYDQFLNDKHSDITIGQPGAPGGSILVSRDLFLKVGGYDDAFFHGYSIEDQFFYNKLLLFTEVKSIQSVDLVHLFHGNSHAKTENFHMEILNSFNAFNQVDKVEFVSFLSKRFAK
jgi:predicted glycosyltransferase involved in capsule biosynthesis